MAFKVDGSVAEFVVFAGGGNIFESRVIGLRLSVKHATEGKEKVIHHQV